jgi:hypothetical protein
VRPFRRIPFRGLSRGLVRRQVTPVVHLSASRHRAAVPMAHLLRLHVTASPVADIVVAMARPRDSAARTTGVAEPQDLDGSQFLGEATEAFVKCGVRWRELLMHARKRSRQVTLGAAMRKLVEIPAQRVCGGAWPVERQQFGR